MIKLLSGKRLNLGIFGALLLVALFSAFAPTGVLASSVTTLTLSPTSVFPGDSVTATWNSTEAATGCTGVIDNADGAGVTTYPLPAFGSNGNLKWNVPGTFGVSIFCTNASGIGATVRKTVTVNARASGAYTCTANILTPSVTRGESARVEVVVANAAEPVYVFARAQQGWSSLPLMPLYPIVQSIDGCVKDPLTSDSCRDNDLYTKVSAPGGSVTINALTNTIHTDLGAQSFRIFCSTNRPLSNYSEGTGADNAQNTRALTASYTVVGGGKDCLLTGGPAAGNNTGNVLTRPLFNGATQPPNFALAKSGTATFSIKNSGATTANLATDSPTAGIAIVSLGATTLAPGATTLFAVTFNSTTDYLTQETFNLTSSCGGTTYTYPLVGRVPFVCTGTCVSPPPPPPITFYEDGDFPIFVSGEDVTITEGQTIVRDVVVGNPKGYVGNVKIHAERMLLPPGVNATFSPTSGTLSTGESFHTKVTFKADGLVLAGTYKYQLAVDVKNPPGYNVGTPGINTKNLVMTTQNKVIPTKAMSATVNTLRPSIAKQLSIRIETPGQTEYPCHPYACLNEYASTVGTTFFAVKSWTNPVMILDEAHWKTDMGARYYSLADPMNPTHDSSKDLTLDNHWAGDFGSQMYPWSLAYSMDGRYEIGNQWNQGTLGSTPEYQTYGASTGIPFDGSESGDPVDIFQSNSHVYFTYLTSGGVVRLDGVKKSAPYLYLGGSTTFDWIYPELPDTAPNIPKATGNYPTGSGVNTTVMAGAKDYVAVLTGPGDWRSVAPNKLSIYSAGDSSAVAEIDVKNVAGGIQNLTSFVTSEVQYIMFTTYLPSLPHAITDPADPNIYKDINNPKYRQNQLFVYKFDPKTNTLTKVVEGKLIVGEIGGGLTGHYMAGIRVGDKDGVIMLLRDDIAKDDNQNNNFYGGEPFEKLKIFMFSDLAAGNLKDVYADAGYSISSRTHNLGSGGAAAIASLNKGDTTYVYLNNFSFGNPFYGIAVLKFDPSGVNVGTAPTAQHMACVSNACTLVDGSGVDSCSADAGCTSSGGGIPPDGGGPAGDCDFTLTSDPASRTVAVPTGQSSFIGYTLSATKPADTTCPAVQVTLQTLKDASGNTVATPRSSNPLTIAPGGSNVAIFEVQKVPGTYQLLIKAYGRLVQITKDLGLVVQ